MYTQATLIALLVAAAEARFGQEQGNGAITAIGALTDLGNSGQAATLAGGSIQFLLGGANPCGKLTQADNIIATLGTSDRAIAAARGLVAAEQNFNPFAVSIPSICSDPTLPTTAALRGVVPLIDPAVGGQDVENANSATSIVTPFNADGLSVAQVMAAQGFTNFTAVAVDGTKSTPGAAGAVVAAPASNSTASSSAVAAPVSTDAAAIASSAAGACGAAPPSTLVTLTKPAATATTAAAAATTAASAGAATGATGATRDTSTCTGSGQTLVCTAPAAGAGAVSDPVTGTFDGFVASTIAGLDFGICVPTMKFEAGLNGRDATASTFQAIDPLCNKGQQEALNPAIITNRIHDQMTNACGANQAAKDAITAAQAMIVALGTRDATTADAFNTALGFAGTNTNPDNAPQTGLVGHT